MPRADKKVRIQCGVGSCGKKLLRGSFDRHFKETHKDLDYKKRNDYIKFQLEKIPRTLIGYRSVKLDEKDFFSSKIMKLFKVQLLIGTFLLFLSARIDSVMENKQVVPLAVCFFILNFLVATQDIVVDGWALTLRSRKNAGAAANCNAAGQTLGAFFGYGFFMALSDADFVNKCLRSAENSSPLPLVTTAGYFAFWGACFIILTVLIAALKSEKDDESLKPPPLKETYKTMLAIFKLHSVRTLILLWFTCKSARR
ncbi:Oidioi.mRNA.OKI2018_I69.YSR.g17122.t1.cds [Oikopleura dioica]|uniref:Oidioi.mRNA.OKI2018_I69.YSR.g17122.t1.cds n=1 Tax=Oikopleura dioica TaxID=34765 RepID=A0ABN7SNC6_OIKDI|nr:Oidioi.mRNA.OKI2018_I69.YSR.g17122.t1.cds [Oikopleura dioica]